MAQVTAGSLIFDFIFDDIGVLYLFGLHDAFPCTENAGCTLVSIPSKMDIVNETAAATYTARAVARPRVASHLPSRYDMIFDILVDTQSCCISLRQSCIHNIYDFPSDNYEPVRPVIRQKTIPTLAKVNYLSSSKGR